MLRETARNNQREVRTRGPLRLALAGGGTTLGPWCGQFADAVLNITTDRGAYSLLEPSDNGPVCLTAADSAAIVGAQQRLHAAAVDRFLTQELWFA